MGRKIPGRKHRGVRDPEQQNALRLSKKKVNAPPSQVDDQPVPKSVLRIARLIKESKTSSKVPKKQTKKIKPLQKTKKLVKIHTKVGKNEKPVPTFEQRKGESNNSFLYRVNRICDNVKREAAFEKKYGLDVKRNPETGKLEGLEKCKKDPVEMMLKNVRKEKKEKKRAKKKKKDDKPAEVKLTKSQKRQLKLKERKKNKDLANEDGFKKFNDSVKFGEVVHAPPSLDVPRNVAKKCEASRPGQKELLLKSLITDVKKGVAHKTIDKKGKRKDLPNALRRQLEQQQKEIIEAYKTMKLEKNKNKS